MKGIKKINSRPIAIAVASAIAASLAVPSVAVLAQGIEEIVISAERRDTTASTTAISMEVITGEELAKQQLITIEDLQSAVPGLQFGSNGSHTQANIRGVGNPSGGEPSEQVGVAILIDGSAQGEEFSANGSFFDLGNVQVLRGPQGTFIGQSAAGGAILLNSVRPNFDGVNGYIEGDVGDYSMQKITGAVNLPISETIAARIAILTSTAGSHYTNENSKLAREGSEFSSPGNREELNYRLGLSWEPNEDFSAYLKLEKGNNSSDGTARQTNPRAFTGQDALGNKVVTYAAHARGPSGELYDNPDPFVINHVGTELQKNVTTQYLLEMNYVLENGITLRSASNLQELQTNFNTLSNASIVPGGRFIQDLHSETTGQEFNIISPEGGTIEWLVGAAYNKRETDLSLNFPGPPGGGQVCGWTFQGTWSACNLDPVTLSDFYIPRHTTVEHIGIFAQLDWNLSETLQLTLGVRQNQDDLYSDIDIGGSGAVTQNETDGDVTTYKVGLNWEPADNQFFYAFYARGYKAPQAVAGFGGTYAVAEELVDDYEFGWKGPLFDSAVYAELGAYYMEYTDMQMSVFQTTDVSASNQVNNIGQSKIKGIEAKLRTEFHGLNINFNFAYTDSELGNLATIDTNTLPFVPGPPGTPRPGDLNKGCVNGDLANHPNGCLDYEFLNLSGQQNLNAPEITYNLRLDYPMMLENGATLTPSLTFSHSDESYSSLIQVDEAGGSVIPGGDKYYTNEERDLINLSLTYDIDDWSVQGYINNVTDEVYIGGLGFGGPTVMYGDPRVIGLRVRMSF